MATLRPPFLSVVRLRLPKRKLLSDFRPNARLVEAVSVLEEQAVETKGEALLDVLFWKREDGGEALDVLREVAAGHKGAVEELAIKGVGDKVSSLQHQLYIFVVLEVGGSPALNVDRGSATLHEISTSPTRG